MKEDQLQYSQRIRHTENSDPPHTDGGRSSNHIVRLILVIWMVGAFTAVLIAYLVTRDTVVVLIWTTVTTLATIVFTFFFSQRN